MDSSGVSRRSRRLAVMVASLLLVGAVAQASCAARVSAESPPPRWLLVQKAVADVSAIDPALASRAFDSPSTWIAGGSTTWSSLDIAIYESYATFAPGHRIEIGPRRRNLGDVRQRGVVLDPLN